MDGMTIDGTGQPRVTVTDAERQKVHDGLAIYGQQALPILTREPMTMPMFEILQRVGLLAAVADANDRAEGFDDLLRHIASKLSFVSDDEMRALRALNGPGVGRS